MQINTDQWFTDGMSRDSIQRHVLTAELHGGRNACQSVRVTFTEVFGKCLVLVSRIQSSGTC
jgi:hypothetical protein